MNPAMMAFTLARRLYNATGLPVQVAQGVGDVVVVTVTGSRVRFVLQVSEESIHVSGFQHYRRSSRYAFRPYTVQQVRYSPALVGQLASVLLGEA